MQKDIFLDLVKREYEGYATHMYLDSKGYVTIGIGILLKHASSASDFGVSFINRKTGKSATSKEVEQEWKNIHKLSKGRTLSYYFNNSSLDADEALLQVKFDELMQNALRDAKKFYPKYDLLPTPAQFALWDMSFNLGYSKLTKYQNLKKALEENDFEKASLESRRNGVQPKRNYDIQSWMKASKSEKKEGISATK